MENGKLALTVSDACKTLCIGRTLAYQMIRNGTLPHIRVGSKKILIPADSVRAWLSEQASVSSPAR